MDFVLVTPMIRVRGTHYHRLVKTGGVWRHAVEGSSTRKLVVQNRCPNTVRELAAVILRAEVGTLPTMKGATRFKNHNFIK